MDTFIEAIRESLVGPLAGVIVVLVCVGVGMAAHDAILLWWRKR